MRKTRTTIWKSFFARSRFRQRRGATLVLAAFLLVVMLGVLAFAIDLGYVMNTQVELKRATDAAALAGAGTLVDGTEAAELQALDFMLRNPVGQRMLAEEENREQLLAEWLAEHADEFEVELGEWDPETRTFTANAALPSTMRVSAAYNNAPLFFARLFGRDTFDISAESIARYMPRDIVLVLDFSGSMNDDSELKRIYEYGEEVRTGIEANLLQIYQELGSPTYGSMQWEPQYISSTDRTTIKQTLGLLTYEGGHWVEEPYPYPSGSWNSYIDYVKSYYGTCYRADYYKKYGYLTLVNYWLEQQPRYSQTPDLWKASAQPVGAVKDAVGVFMQYIQEVDCEDRVALVVYNSTSQTALVEHSLTEDFAQIADTAQHRQAAHYDNYTNIGAGIYYARQELAAHARAGSFKMIVLMTDGQANRPSDTTTAKNYVLQQAQAVAAEEYPIVTISLGNGADTNLMQQVADLTDGVHFNVPGGETVTDYQADLLEVFRTIADDRPLVLVK
jgi:Flp pilus assembly protein TadG